MGSVNTWISMAAGAVALCGVVVVVLALFRDRSRGRRRCPKCWYEMTGVAGLTCPECGRAARSERRLLRTRRRYGQVVVGVMLAVVAGGTAAALEVTQKGWKKAIPSAGYVAALPWMDSNGWGMRELKSRASAGTMRRWELRWMIRRSVATLERSVDPDQQTSIMYLLCETERNRWERQVFQPYLKWERASEVEPIRAVTALARLLGSENREVQGSAAYVLQVFKEAGAGATTALLGHLDTDDRRFLNGLQDALRAIDGADDPLALRTVDYFNFTTRLGEKLPYERLRESWGDSEATLDVLDEMLEDEYAPMKAVAIWALGKQFRDRPEVERRVLEMANAPERAVRRAVVEFAAAGPLTKETSRIIAAAIDDPELVAQGLQAASCFPGSVGVFGPAIKRSLKLDNDQLRLRAATVWVRTGGEPRDVSDVVLKLVDGALEYGLSSDAADMIDVVAEVGDGSAQVLRRLAELMEHSDRGIRASASFATIRLTNDREHATGVLTACVREADQKSMFGEEEVSWYVWRAARLQLLDVSAFEDWLTDPSPGLRTRGAITLGACGALAASALPRLREMCDDSDGNTAACAQEAVQQIEWELENPEEAARWRERVKRHQIEWK